MTISKSEAEAALSDIARTTGRSYTHRGYHIAGPILILWGVIWLVGYGAMGVLPPMQWGWLWLVLDAIGIPATIVLAVRGRRGSGARGLDAWRPFLWAVAIGGLVGATFAVLRPTDVNAFIAYPGIVTGFAYFVFGLMHMMRKAAVGAAMFVATLIGFFLFPDILTWWMAGVGGIGLILGGLWMRSA